MHANFIERPVGITDADELAYNPDNNGQKDQAKHNSQTPKEGTEYQEKYQAGCHEPVDKQRRLLSVGPDHIQQVVVDVFINIKVLFQIAEIKDAGLFNIVVLCL